VDPSQPAQAVQAGGEPGAGDIVAEKLQLRWSPQQIAGWLKMTYPHDPEMQVSHESIYRSPAAGCARS
jgi:IS30 family transposase